MSVTEIDRPAVSTASAIPGRQNPLDLLSAPIKPSDDATDVMAQAGLLGWNVRLRPLETALETISATGVEKHESRLHVPGAYATVRDNPKTGREEVIGVVGSKYRPQQVEQLADILTGLVEASGGQITHAADYYGTGATVFFGVELPTSMMVGGRDLVDHVVTCFTSNDGSLSTTFAISSLRAMCANMRQQVLSASASSFTVRHTASANARLAQAQDLLGLAWKKAKAYGDLGELLISKTLTDEVFFQITAQIFEDKLTPTTERAKTMQANRNYALKQILHGPTNANIDGTAWAGLQTVSEYLEYNNKSANTNALRTIKTTGALQNKIVLAEKMFSQV
jgi:phage/plasmid-like protein (TIGR03299 family)